MSIDIEKVKYNYINELNIVFTTNKRLELESQKLEYWNKMLIGYRNYYSIVNHNLSDFNYIYNFLYDLLFNK